MKTSPGCSGCITLELALLKVGSLLELQCCGLNREVLENMFGGSPGSTMDFNGVPKSVNLLHGMPLSNENIPGVQRLLNAGTATVQSWPLWTQFQ